MIYLKVWWAIHNIIGHPVAELCHWVSLFGLIRPIDRVGGWVHDWTIPRHEKGTGRG